MDLSIKKNKTYTLNLTKFELIHLRDLFGVALPPSLTKTVSQALAETEERSMVETSLWNKIVSKCKSAKVPLNEHAPDFICAGASSPPIGVFRLASEPPTETTEDEHESNPFSDDDVE